MYTPAVTELIDPLVIELALKVSTRSRRRPAGLLRTPLELPKIMQRHLNEISSKKYDSSAFFEEVQVNISLFSIAVKSYTFLVVWYRSYLHSLHTAPHFFALACNKPLARLMRDRWVVHSRALYVGCRFWRRLRPAAARE